MIPSLASRAAALIGLVVYLPAIWALAKLRETHGLDLDYVEKLEVAPVGDSLSRQKSGFSPTNEA
ncbi:MAG: hypothetical protein HGA90_05145 [Alphaproteobacteria bacterium]|nr:hypothetical protein [Alphaproteobacteria bacterium]